MIQSRPALIFVLMFALLATSLAVEAQPPAKIARIGILRTGSAPDPLVDAFTQGLRDLGYAEGRNITIEYRWADGREINLKTAKSLGLTLPQPLVLRADQVIQ